MREMNLDTYCFRAIREGEEKLLCFTDLSVTERILVTSQLTQKEAGEMLGTLGDILLEQVQKYECAKNISLSENYVRLAKYVKVLSEVIFQSDGDIPHMMPVIIFHLNEIGNHIQSIGQEL